MYNKNLFNIDKEISKCNLCADMVEHFPKCYPKNRKYLKHCSKNCKQYLTKQLSIIKPRIILSLGDAASKTILDIKYKKFSDIVGKEFLVNGIKVIPIYHPSPISPLSYKGNITIFEKLKKDLYY